MDHNFLSGLRTLKRKNVKKTFLKTVQKTKNLNDFRNFKP